MRFTPIEKGKEKPEARGGFAPKAQVAEGVTSNISGPKVVLPEHLTSSEYTVPERAPQQEGKTFTATEPQEYAPTHDDVELSRVIQEHQQGENVNRVLNQLSEDELAQRGMVRKQRSNGEFFYPGHQKLYDLEDNLISQDFLTAKDQPGAEAHAQTGQFGRGLDPETTLHNILNHDLRQSADHLYSEITKTHGDKWSYDDVINNRLNQAGIKQRTEQEAVDKILNRFGDNVRIKKPSINDDIKESKTTKKRVGTDLIFVAPDNRTEHVQVKAVGQDQLKNLERPLNPEDPGLQSNIENFIERTYKKKNDRFNKTGYDAEKGYVLHNVPFENDVKPHSIFYNSSKRMFDLGVSNEVKPLVFPHHKTRTVAVDKEALKNDILKVFKPESKLAKSVGKLVDAMTHPEVMKAINFATNREPLSPVGAFYSMKGGDIPGTHTIGIFDKFAREWKFLRPTQIAAIRNDNFIDANVKGAFDRNNGSRYVIMGPIGETLIKQGDLAILMDAVKTMEQRAMSTVDENRVLSIIAKNLIDRYSGNYKGEDSLNEFVEKTMDDEARRDPTDKELTGGFGGTVKEFMKLGMERFGRAFSSIDLRDTFLDNVKGVIAPETKKAPIGNNINKLSRLVEEYNARKVYDETKGENPGWELDAVDSLVKRGLDPSKLPHTDVLAQEIQKYGINPEAVSGLNRNLFEIVNNSDIFYGPLKEFIRDSFIDLDGIPRQTTQSIGSVARNITTSSPEFKKLVAINDRLITSPTEKDLKRAINILLKEETRILNTLAMRNFGQPGQQISLHKSASLPQLDYRLPEVAYDKIEGLSFADINASVQRDAEEVGNSLAHPSSKMVFDIPDTAHFTRMLPSEQAYYVELANRGLNSIATDYNALPENDRQSFNNYAKAGFLAGELLASLDDKRLMARPENKKTWAQKVLAVDVGEASTAAPFEAVYPRMDVLYGKPHRDITEDWGRLNTEQKDDYLRTAFLPLTSNKPAEEILSPDMLNDLARYGYNYKGRTVNDVLKEYARRQYTYLTGDPNSANAVVENIDALANTRLISPELETHPINIADNYKLSGETEQFHEIRREYTALLNQLASMNKLTAWIKYTKDPDLRKTITDLVETGLGGAYVADLVPDILKLSKQYGKTQYLTEALEHAAEVGEFDPTGVMLVGDTSVSGKTKNEAAVYKERGGRDFLLRATEAVFGDYDSEQLENVLGLNKLPMDYKDVTEQDLKLAKELLSSNKGGLDKFAQIAVLKGLTNSRLATVNSIPSPAQFGADVKHTELTTFDEAQRLSSLFGVHRDILLPDYALERLGLPSYSADNNKGGYTPLTRLFYGMKDLNDYPVFGAFVKPGAKSTKYSSKINKGYSKYLTESNIADAAAEVLAPYMGTKDVDELGRPIPYTAEDVYQMLKPSPESQYHTSFLAGKPRAISLGDTTLNSADQSGLIERLIIDANNRGQDLGEVDLSALPSFARDKKYDKNPQLLLDEYRSGTFTDRPDVRSRLHEILSHLDRQDRTAVLSELEKRNIPNTYTRSSAWKESVAPDIRLIAPQAERGSIDPETGYVTEQVLSRNPNIYEDIRAISNADPFDFERVQSSFYKKAYEELEKSRTSRQEAQGFNSLIGLQALLLREKNDVSPSIDNYRTAAERISDNWWKAVLDKEDEVFKKLELGEITKHEAYDELATNELAPVIGFISDLLSKEGTKFKITPMVLDTLENVYQGGAVIDTHKLQHELGRDGVKSFIAFLNDNVPSQYLSQVKFGRDTKVSSGTYQMIVPKWDGPKDEVVVSLDTARAILKKQAKSLSPEARKVLNSNKDLTKSADIAQLLLDRVNTIDGGWDVQRMPRINDASNVRFKIRVSLATTGIEVPPNFWIQNNADFDGDTSMVYTLLKPSEIDKTLPINDNKVKAIIDRKDNPKAGRIKTVSGLIRKNTPEEVQGTFDIPGLTPDYNKDLSDPKNKFVPTRGRSLALAELAQTAIEKADMVGAEDVRKTIERNSSLVKAEGYNRAVLNVDFPSAQQGDKSKLSTDKIFKSGNVRVIERLFKTAATLDESYLKNINSELDKALADLTYGAMGEGDYTTYYFPKSKRDKDNSLSSYLKSIAAKLNFATVPNNISTQLNENEHFEVTDIRNNAISNEMLALASVISLDARPSEAGGGKGRKTAELIKDIEHYNDEANTKVPHKVLKEMIEQADKDSVEFAKAQLAEVENLDTLSGEEHKDMLDRLANTYFHDILLSGLTDYRLAPELKDLETNINQRYDRVNDPSIAMDIEGNSDSPKNREKLITAVKQGSALYASIIDGAPETAKSLGIKLTPLEDVQRLGAPLSFANMTGVKARSKAGSKHINSLQDALAEAQGASTPLSPVVDKENKIIGYRYTAKLSPALVQILAKYDSPDKMPRSTRNRAKLELLTMAMVYNDIASKTDAYNRTHEDQLLPPKISASTNELLDKPESTLFVTESFMPGAPYYTPEENLRLTRLPGFPENVRAPHIAIQELEGVPVSQYLKDRFNELGESERGLSFYDKLKQLNMEPDEINYRPLTPREAKVLGAERISTDSAVRNTLLRDMEGVPLTSAKESGTDSEDAGTNRFMTFARTMMRTHHGGLSIGSLNTDYIKAMITAPNAVKLMPLSQAKGLRKLAVNYSQQKTAPTNMHDIPEDAVNYHKETPRIPTNLD